MTTPSVDYLSEDEALELIRGLFLGHNSEPVSEELCEWLLDIDHQARVTICVHKLVIDGTLNVRYNRETEEFEYSKRQP